MARSYFRLLDRELGEFIQRAENAGRHTDIVLSEMGVRATERAVVLFNLLTQCVDNRALQVMMNVEPGNGFQAWKALCETYEPSVGGRRIAMLMGIIAPSWETTRDTEFLEAIETWEVQIRRYEVQSREDVSDSMKIAVLMKHAPSNVRAALRTASSTLGSDYERAKKFVRDYLQSGLVYSVGGDSGKADDKGPAPMDVGAVSKGEKGKKGHQKGKDKGVKKGGKYDKPASGKGQQQPKKFQGECSHCGKWGRKKSECRILAKEKAQKDKKGGGGFGKGTNAIVAPDTGASSSTNAIHYWVEPEGDRQPWADLSDDYPDQRWVMAVRNVGFAETNVTDKVQYVLWDSGSDEHLCRREFGGDLHTRASGVRLMGISGDCLGQLGSKRVRYKILGEDDWFVQSETRFQVSNVASKNVLSAGKMCRAGFVADMRDPQNPFLQHPNLCFRIPLHLHCNSYYLKVTEVETVSEDDWGGLAQHGVFVAPVEMQGHNYQWEFAGIDEDDEGIEAVPVPEAFARDEAHDRPDRMRLHGWSKVADLRARLRELDEPIYGDKHALWQRLQKAEAALRARRSAARDYVERQSQRQQALREVEKQMLEKSHFQLGPQMKKDASAK